MNQRVTLATLLFCLLFCGALLYPALGQNPMFLTADYPYKEVQKTLYNTEYMQILFEEDNNKIAARQGNMLVVYSFEKGRLYNIQLTKSYTKYKAAKDAYDGCITYFASTGAVAVESNEGIRERSVTVSRAGKVYRLAMIRGEDDQIDVSLSSKMVNVAPRSALEGSDFLELEDEEAVYSMSVDESETDDSPAQE